MNAPHTFPIRVYFEDTDFTGIVYHANYLRFIERARTEMLRDLGFHQGAIHTGETGDALFFVVARMQLEFLRPARMDDLLTVETKPSKISAAVIELEQIVRREEEILFTARVLIAALADGKPRRLPREFREKLELREGCVQS
ncbi:tol-pal system-associated acyl-CoA thioesterase [Rhodoblastus sp.]|jgi:acyl-CoA thioester hydrolase|uniref:tol-pal system-associated acyl-CoA thioesterase n=1 Tax=Rhodoblastus sp. TaxID=1962975 RepID=UPI0025F2F2FC|nr:tol-pal system-associated acyl-CoA thioesterase [Rhodoblastus sp.]